MTDESWPERDLWGQPGRAPPDPRGRKRHRRLPQIAEAVALLRATDLSIEGIASRVNLSVPTLRKYYFRELEKGPDLARAVVLQALYAKAKDGNVTAAKAYLREAEKGQTAPPVSRRAPKEEPLGKKALADQTAQTAHEGSEWADLLH